jgi:hypothetical protein
MITSSKEVALSGKEVALSGKEVALCELSATRERRGSSLTVNA